MTPLTSTELLSECLEVLPARETLSVQSLNWAGLSASNAALAVNAGAKLAEAAAEAHQTVWVQQG